MKSFSRMLKGFGRNAEEQIQKLTDKYIEKIDKIVEVKSKEILTV